MTKQISGIHHVTAIAGDPQRNVDFYAGVLGLRLVKLTVNFDDPGTYHLYYGDYSGSPGTIITFFPWKGVPKGRPGSGQMTVTSFSVPKSAIDFWKQRLASIGISFTEGPARFGDDVLSFNDYDGMQLELVAGVADDLRSGWQQGPVPDEAAIRGFYGATLSVAHLAKTEKLLTETMNFRKTGQDGRRHRFETGNGGPNAIVDLIDASKDHAGRQGAGTVHHIAWRTPDDEEQIAWQGELTKLGYGVSPVMDRQYFHSIYYREPNGILFEIATDAPGFATDEPLDELGTHLKLPEWFEKYREQLIQTLPALKVPQTEVSHV